MAICVLKRQSPSRNEYPHLNVATPTTSISLRRYGEQETKKELKLLRKRKDPHFGRV